ncbi:MAG TPA: DUF3515 domain-containing protein [Pseudonocardiaceae bacterium]|nr:DUF3515 domain-containing protein [Pseudonocardiaceae bacterium]
MVRPERRLSPPLIVALCLGVLLVVGIGVAGLVLGPGNGNTPAAAPTTRPSAPATGPVLLVPVDAPKAGTPQCTALLHALPATLANGSTPLHRRQLAAPAPPATAAWGAGGDPVVLRCGIERPPELRPTSELLAVDGVQWFQVSADGLTTWYAVDRAVVVALTLPGTVGTGPIQAVSAAVSSTMPAVPVF